MQVILELRPELVQKLEDIAIEEDLSLDDLVEAYLQIAIEKSKLKSVRSEIMTQGLSDIIDYLKRENRLCTARDISNATSIQIGRVRSLCSTLIVAGKISWTSTTKPGNPKNTSYYFDLSIVLPVNSNHKSAVYQHIYNNPGCELCLVSRRTGVSIENVGAIVQELIRDKKVRTAEKQLNAGAILTVLFSC